MQAAINELNRALCGIEEDRHSVQHELEKAQERIQSYKDRMALLKTKEAEISAAIAALKEAKP